ncbi:MAG: Uma2 family endonuclease [Chloroflexi bacterium]|nr:Uma2 family endonuclease [Chloroflexota bacterium]
MTVSDYLEWEERQEFKHEYIDGDIIEMTSGTLRHTRITTNVGGTLFAFLDFSVYIICNSDMRLRVGPTRYVYPDFTVVRGEAVLEDEKELTLLNPIFVIEVTSPSSLKYDRVDKLGFYLDVPSIEAYLIIDQDRIRADLFTRADEGWHLRVFNDPGDVIPLAMLKCELSLEQVYRGIEVANA